MADSIREQILRTKVVPALQTITRANGYRNDLRNVQRFNQRGNEYSQLPCIVVHEGDDEPDDGPLAGALSLTTRKLRVHLEVVGHHAETDGRSSEEVVNALRADVEKAVMADRRWDNLAIETSPIRWSPIFVEPGQPDLTTYGDCTITYRHRHDDPAIGG